MKVSSIDQSLSKTALILWEDGEPIERFVIRSGHSRIKEKSKIRGVPYFNSEDEQMEHITSIIHGILIEFVPDIIMMESLSYGSIGRATRDLAGLFYVMRNAFFLEFQNWKSLQFSAPSTIKAVARGFLPEEQRTVPKPNGKKGTNLKKMEKGDMIIAIPERHRWILDGFRMSGIKSGLDDLADAYFLGICAYNNN